MHHAPALVRRRSLLLGGLAATAVALAGCGSDEPASAPAGGADLEVPEGPWTFTDDLGETVELEAAPTRIAGLGDQVAALWDFGIAPVATFGMLSIQDDVQFEGFDTTDVVEVGTAYGEIDVEALAAQAPELIVTHVYPVDAEGSLEGALLYGFKDQKQVDLVRGIAPIVAIAQRGSAIDVIERNAELAASLGVDLETGEVARKKQAFEDAAAALTEAAATGTSVVALAAYEGDAVYIARAQDDPALRYYTSLGVTYPDVSDAEYYWDTLSWEKVDTYQTDVVLTSLRAMDAEALQQQPTFAALPAARADQVYAWQFEPLSYGKQAAWMEKLAGYLADAQQVA
jgi:iron complex transport system substrate-binding protein